MASGRSFAAKALARLDELVVQRALESSIAEVAREAERFTGREIDASTE